ncbi:hypothetical protein [Cupriavidus plantarum]|uniref:hypothetical protein n=1 Tax=Cupriavidus plantarum TaxID=942865 RepID=UPI000EAD13B2|nr:hypothetical protein [Cupriavidus plantarum]RLK44581.1 hypothetical protein C7417_0565 [Cupriavidus plantarum]
MNGLSGTSLANITPQVIAPRDTISARQAEKSAPTADADSTTQTTSSAGTTINEADHSTRIQGPSLSGNAASAGGAAQSDEESSDSVAIKTIKEQIAQIQKQLAVVQQQIQSIQSSNTDDRTKAAQLGGLQAQANTLQGALQAAMGKLAEAIQEESGSLVGNNVDTTA